MSEKEREKEIRSKDQQIVLAHELPKLKREM
jgi:hypothetical protein